ncbi:lantibiotic dehydratase [Kribbella sp. DT2]|uniref:lantibiotic dehydratase n=1 Tax=Kribbella sp. DT2 TaxID=3393427 RepID=UPI003CF2FA9C
MTDLHEMTRQPDLGPGQWRLGPTWLLRVAGQPAARAEALRTPAAVAWTEEVFAAEAERDRVGEIFRLALETAISGLGPEDSGRITLINLRRDVFNARRPRPVIRERAQAALPEVSWVWAERWIAAVDRLAELRVAGPGILADDVARVRAVARQLLDDGKLRSAVLLQSEVLEKNMDRYLDPARKLDKSGRQVERTLLELLYRAALKTSPFSTLTSVGLGEFRADSVRRRPEPASLRQQSTVRLNIAVLARLSAVILADPSLRSGLRVTLAPGASTNGETMRYVRRRTALGNDPDAVVAIDSVHEDLFFLPSGPVLAEVAELTRDVSVPLHELAAHLTGAGDRGRAEVDQLLGHLLRLGFLLAPDLQIDLRAAEPTVRFVRALELQDNKVLKATAALLAETLSLVGSYRETLPRGRAAVLAQIKQRVSAAFETIGGPLEAVPRTVLYEDTTVTGAGLDVDARRWDREVLPALADLADVLPAFDLNLPRRLTAKGFFVARYGAGGSCPDVVRFCHEFQRDFFDPYSQRAMRRRQFDDDNTFVPQENWFKLDGIEAVDRARELASAYLRDRKAASGPDVEEIQLGSGFVEQVRAALPPGRQLAQPWSFFVQVADDGGDGAGRVVLNQAYAGLTLMFSRFAHSLEDGGVPAQRLIRDTVRGYAPDGAVLAELRGGYETTNLNVHPVVTDYEIVCPGDASSRPVEEQIGLADLYLLHDPEADRVRLMSARLGREVIPVYLGFLMPMALPEIQQVLLCFSPSGMAQIDLWAGTGDPVPAEGITSYPRLMLGELVLQRRMWKLSTDVFPFRDSRNSDAEHLLRVQRWRREHGLPRRLFAQTDSGAARSPGDDADHAGPDRKTGRKPLPVDFDSWLSLVLLEQLALGAKNRIVLTEANPDVDQLWLRDEEGSAHVSELLLELYDTGRDSDDR